MQLSLSALHSRYQYSIAHLLLAVFWMACIIALLLSMLRLHNWSWPIGRWEPETLGKQILINVGIGIAVGGWIGGFRRPGMGLVIGGSAAFVTTCLWIVVRILVGLFREPVFY